QVGVCICDDHADCATSQYCGWGANTGQCQNKKSAGATCAYGYECISNTCSMTFSGPRCK
ncbi:MAG TPA: hypothetical protein VEZ71_19550, partial [Archangium sp.]|nr:hypothetical protein [Archangium sp.]